MKKYELLIGLIFLGLCLAYGLDAIAGQLHRIG